MPESRNNSPSFVGPPQKEHIDIIVTEYPAPLGGLLGIERQKKATDMAEAAEQQFSVSLANIQRLIGSCNPMQLLAHFGYYDQIIFNGSRKTEDYQPVEQNAIEWLQALILQVPEDQINANSLNQPSAKTLIDLNEELHKAKYGFAWKRLGRGSSKPNDSLAAELVRQHTAFVRNEGYPSQIKRMRRGVFSPIDEEFRQREGHSLSELDAALWRLTELFEQRLNADRAERHEILRQKSTPAIIEAFSKLIQQDPHRVASDMKSFAHDRDAVCCAVLNHIDSRNFRHFYFNAEEFQNLFERPVDLALCKKLLKNMSIGWGELKGLNPEHFILANPIWKKPLIAVGNDQYFLPIAGMVQSFGLDVLESALTDHPDLEKKYRSKARADFLEKSVEEIVRNTIPNGQVFRGLKWRDNSGREGETDILVILDSHALVLECKSGAVRDRARRGDFVALKQELKELIDEPSTQGKRFGDFILSNRSLMNLFDSQGVSHQINFSGLLRVTTVNVLLDYVGPVATQFGLLKETGIRSDSMSPVATLTLHELECVVEILNQPALIFHYFRRRAELEANCEPFSDEFGLLALYLASSFDIGDFEGRDHGRLTIPSLQQELEPYFMGKELGLARLKPAPKLTQWWKDMLEKFEQRKFLGWLEVSYTLLCTNFERQTEFEAQCEKLVEEVWSSLQGNRNDTCIMINGGKGSRVAIIGVVIGNQTREEARELVQDRIAMVVEQHNVNRLIAICISTTSDAYPYLAVYFHCPELEAP